MLEPIELGHLLGQRETLGWGLMHCNSSQVPDKIGTESQNADYVLDVAVDWGVQHAIPQSTHRSSRYSADFT